MNGIDKCEVENRNDPDGNPTGGSVKGVGLDINWQDGPLGRGNERIEPNGAFVETVISAALQRIEYYQEANDGKFNCDTNANAISHLQNALSHLEARTKDREEREVEGTHQK